MWRLDWNLKTLWGHLLFRLSGLFPQNSSLQSTLCLCPRRKLWYEEKPKKLLSVMSLWKMYKSWSQSIMWVFTILFLFFYWLTFLYFNTRTFMCLVVHSDRACDKTLKRCKLAHDEIEMPTSSPEDDSSSNSNDQVVSKFDALTAAMQEQRMKNLALIEGRKLVINLKLVIFI